MGELLLGPGDAIPGHEFGAQDISQLYQVVDVEGRVDQPGGRQWACGPVVRRMGLAQPDTEFRVEKGGETNRRLPEKTTCQFGVEQSGWSNTHIHHAGKILRCRVNDPHRIGAGVGEPA